MDNHEREVQKSLGLLCLYIVHVSIVNHPRRRKDSKSLFIEATNDEDAKELAISEAYAGWNGAVRRDQIKVTYLQQFRKVT